MIIIHQTEVDSIKKRMEEALKNGKHMTLMFYMDRVQIATILGLIEQYEAMKAGEEYRKGYEKGFIDAKGMAIKAVGGIKINAGT